MMQNLGRSALREQVVRRPACDPGDVNNPLIVSISSVSVTQWLSRCVLVLSVAVTSDGRTLCPDSPLGACPSSERSVGPMRIAW